MEGDETHAVRRFAQDTGWAMVSSAVAMGVGFLLNLLIGNRLGPEGLGVFFMAVSLYTTTSMIGAFGVHVALIKYASEFRDEQARLNDLTSAAVATSAMLGLASALFLGGLSRPLGWLFRMPELPAMLAILALALPPFLVNKTLLGLLNSLRAMRAYAICESLRYWANAVLVLLFFALHMELQGAAWAMVAAEVAVLLALVGATRRRFHFCLRNLRQEGGRLLVFGAKSLLVGVVGEINSRVSLLVAGYHLGEAQVGVYTVALTLVRGMSIVPGALQKVAWPAVSYLHGKGQSEAVASLVRDVAKYAFLLLFAVSLWIALFGQELIGFLYPKQREFFAAVEPLRILLGGAMLQGAIVAIGATHTSLGRPELGLWVGLPTLLLNVILNLLLVPDVGINGSAIAAVLVHGVQAVLVLIMLSRVLRIRIPLAALAFLFSLGIATYVGTLWMARSVGPVLAGLAGCGAQLLILCLTGILSGKDWARFRAVMCRSTAR